jgi:hypothetical protein
MTRAPVRAAGTLLLLMGAPIPAQQLAASRAALAPAPGAVANEWQMQDTASTPPLFPRARAAIDRLPIWSAPLASAIVPGLGQARLHKDRFAAYLAAEGFFLVQYAKDSRERARSAREYRAIARDIARRNFTASPPDTIWQYYEKLEKFLESGAYTMAPNGPVVPESDTATYNGSLWLLARRQYGVPLDDPSPQSSDRYALALALYETRAVRQPYRWSWRNAQLEQDLFRRTIARSNDASRHATFDLIALIANHLLSTVDAFASVRLMQLEGGGVQTSIAIPVR